MRVVHHISLTVPQHWADEVRTIIRPLACSGGWKEIGGYRVLAGFTHSFDHGDPEYEYVKSELSARGITFHERTERVYDQQELRRCPLLLLRVGRSLAVDAKECGTTYDLSLGCPACGTGAIQSSPYFLPALGVLDNMGFVKGPKGELFVGSLLRQVLDDLEIANVELRGVRHRDCDTPSALWQVICTLVMPPMSEATSGIIRDARMPPCPSCMQDGHYFSNEVPVEVVYSRESVCQLGMPDWAVTWERFGRSNKTRTAGRTVGYAYPFHLISSRLFDVFTELQVRNVEYLPVRIDG